MLQLQSIQFLLVILIPSIFISDSNVIAQAPDRPDLLLRCRSIDKPYHFIKDPVSCNGYYLCFNGTVSPGDCQIGLHFNEQEQICDSPSKVRCADLECPRHIGFIPRRNSCKQFHLCSQGIVIRDFECPNGSHFDVIEERCNYPEVVQCGRDVCPQQTDAFDIIMRPHPDECGKFFICNNNHKREFSCAEGFHWNSHVEKCLFAEDAGCEVDTHKFECPDVTDEGALRLTFHAHPQHRDKYFICVGETAHLRVCGQDLVFNRKEERCTRTL